MKAIKNRLFGKFQEGIALAVLICPLPSHFWDTEVYNLPKKNQAQLVLAIKPAGLDNHRREKLAELLAAISPQTAAIQKELYIDLAETPIGLQTVLAGASPEDNLNRARILTRYNRNTTVLETLKSNEPPSCEIAYLRSLAYRRLRNYKEARQNLAQTIQICEGDFKKKALFLNARIAAMNSSETALETLDNFLKLYPKDSYTDDVLLWKAHVLKDLGRPQKAGSVLETLLKKHPTHNMS